MFPRLLRRPLGLLCLVGLLLLAAGCGGGPTQVATVTGTLRYNGEPVPRLVVHFVPDDGRASWALTDDNGRFALQFDRQTPGAMLGKHKVYLEYRQTSPKSPAAPAPEFVPLLQKYGHLDKTPLNFEITRDGQDIAIQLN